MQDASDTHNTPSTTAAAVAPAPAPAKRPFSWGRIVPIGVLVAGLVAFFAFGLNKYISFEQLAQHREALNAWVADYGLLAALIAGLAYAVMTAFSIPGGALATLVVGFLFGLYAGSVIVILGATIGATGVFLAARTALGDSLRAKAGKSVRRMEEGFKEDAFSYLLFLRLVPIFPFWLVNLVPAFLGVSLRTYVAATLLGIIPGTVVYVSVGNGLGAVFDSGKTPDLGIIFQWDVLLPIVGLSLLALVPVVYKRIKRSRG